MFLSISGKRAENMRYAIISDIHGNVEALQAVLNDIKKQSIDSVICLGDIVGYVTGKEKRFVLRGRQS